MPTSCVDDIFCSFSTIEQAVDAVLAYFFGEPTIIGEWSCPLHRHPELSIDGVHQALTNALVVTPAEFAVIECERKARFAAEVAARTPPLYLQWDEERRIEWAADPQSAEIETSIAASRKAVGLKPIGDPLPPGSPSDLADVSYPFLEYLMGSQFLSIAHIHESTKTLKVRRDMQEAVIVSST